MCLLTLPGFAAAPEAEAAEDTPVLATYAVAVKNGEPLEITRRGNRGQEVAWSGSQKLVEHTVTLSIDGQVLHQTSQSWPALQMGTRWNQQAPDYPTLMRERIQELMRSQMTLRLPSSYMSIELLDQIRE